MTNWQVPCGDICTDGKIRRFSVDGDRPGSKNGWAIAFDKPVRTIVYGSWKTGERHTWSAKDHRSLTRSERAEYAHNIHKARMAREAEERNRHSAARAKAKLIWQNAVPAMLDHPYLCRKQVKAHGIRQSRGALVIPMCDVSGAIYSVQFIHPNGNKRFLSGGRIKGCFLMIGTPGPVICIAEGYATAASIHEVTGHPVAVAFNCGNLKSVALALRKKYPYARITICADNDDHTPGNPGLTKAREAAQACDGHLAVPPIVGDFNDFITGGVTWQ
jgi:putative DNA primase/helicase